jgi:hypothetical protein
MKSHNYTPIPQQEVLFKVDDFADGFSGFVQPGSGCNFNFLERRNETLLYFTNTGSTELKFRLAENESFDQHFDSLILKPGELIKLEMEEMQTLSCKILHVTNLHPEKEGSFIILIIEDYKKKLKANKVIS